MSAVTGQKPIPIGASKPRVFAFAEQAAKRFNFAPGDSMEPLVSRLGGRIAYGSPVTAGVQAQEAIIVDGPRRFTIYLPATTSVQRDRFTIAHELGHFFLHYPMVQQKHPGASMVATRWVDSSDPIAQRAEWEANWFAAAFLMPADKFRADMGRSDSHLAAKYGVSEQAISIRRKTVG